MNDLREELKQQAVYCRVLHRNTIVLEFSPLCEEKLWVPIVIHDLGETAQGNFSYEYRHFLASGVTKAVYECMACKTIEKFGKAIQFKERFFVEFYIST